MNQIISEKIRYHNKILPKARICMIRCKIGERYVYKYFLRLFYNEPLNKDKKELFSMAFGGEFLSMQHLS